jgi:transposase
MMTKRRRYSDEFKLDAIRLVKEQGYNRSEAARNLGIDSGMLGRWILDQERNEAALKPGTPAGDLQDEVKRLREENRKLKMEREILVKAAAFFAKESS